MKQRNARQQTAEPTNARSASWQQWIRCAAYILALTIVPIAVFTLLPTHVRYEISESYVFSGSDRASSVALAVMVPSSGPYQTVSDAHVVWNGSLAREPRAGMVLLLMEGAVEANALQTATVSYEVVLRQGRTSWSASVSPAHTAPQRQIESDHPTLVAQARQIAAATPEQTARRAFRFAAGHLRWPTGTRIGSATSALEAYESQIGGCSEFAALMVALCRAADVPAVTITGLAFSPLMPPYINLSATWSHPAGSHAWVEVFTGDAWVLADPSWASRIPAKGLWFARSDGTHLYYGETAHHDAQHEAMMAWVEDRGTLVGAMSAPLKFAASASAASASAASASAASDAVDGVRLEPSVTVRKVSDSRWPATAATFGLLTLAFSIIERRLTKASKAPQGAEGRPNASGGAQGF